MSECLLYSEMQVLDEIQGRASGFGHSALQRPFGEIILAEQPGLFLTQSQDFPDKLGVVMGFGPPDGLESLPEMPAQPFIIEVFHGRQK